MKALTLTQPWATLIACGAKRIETRSWGTDFRGQIAIHAAKGLGPVGGKRGLTEQCNVAIFASALGEKSDPAKLPMGAIICIANLVDCKSTNVPTWINQLTFQERVFGNYDVNRYGWFLEEVQCLPDPIHCKGALGLWEVPREIQQRLRMQLEGVTELGVAETRSPTLWPA